MVQPLPNNQDQLFRLILWSTLGMYALLGLVVGVIKVRPPAPPDVTQPIPRR